MEIKENTVKNEVMDKKNEKINNLKKDLNLFTDRMNSAYKELNFTKGNGLQKTVVAIGEELAYLTMTPPARFKADIQAVLKQVSETDLEDIWQEFSEGRLNITIGNRIIDSKRTLRVNVYLAESQKK